MSVARHHSEWLSLVENSGPFLSMPVLMRIFPQGLDQRDPNRAKELRLAYEEWLDNPDAPGRNRAWVGFVLTRLLEFPATSLADGQNIPPGLEAPMAEYGEMLRPDIVVLPPQGNAGAEGTQLLIQIYPPGQGLDTPVAGKHWKASPATRMTELSHAANVPLGLVTNGEQWMLVFAPRGETTGYASWYAALWQEEPITLRAFHSLLHVRRFFGVPEGDTLLALLKESAHDQQEVTGQLGLQVRRAVEVLVQAFDRLDQDSGRKLLGAIETQVLYEAALTVMMRLVFLFSAEERGLLRLGESLYDENYAVSTLREQLRDAADQHGEEVLERRFDAWSRLLATFRAVHAGVAHESLRLPAYGGTLFDPDRYPLLEGRPAGTSWRDTPAEPLAVNNRVVLHLLESLQLLQIKVPGGGPAESRRLSFRALDIEQIGHVYEGLLDHTAVRAPTTILGLQGTKSKELEIPLETLEKLLVQGEDKLVELLKEETNRSESALRRALKEPQLVNEHKLLIACRQDTSLRDRVLPFAGLVREDSFQMPTVILTGSVYVTQGTTRRSTGTHYTPRSLTEPIVQHTLEALVYEGPIEGWPKEKWKLKLPKEILSLKVCDMTMGSGAFLVQACRYLAERLVEAWENLEQINPGKFIVAPEGDLSAGSPAERLLPRDPAERLAIARRAVADCCLYGVDMNSMAVEMAKLSLWLVTVQKDKPFTFLDHALKCGDSLLGLCRFKQLETFSLDDAQAKQMLILSNYDELIRTAIAKRRELEALASNNAAQIAVKEALNSEAEERLSRLKLASDLLIAAMLTKGNDQQKDYARVDAHLKAIEYMHKPLEEFYQFVRKRLNNRRPFHWPLEFPEILELGGFDAFVGNPPYLGGKRISFRLGQQLFNYLKSTVGHAVGTTDLCVFFLLRGTNLLKSPGCLGVVVSDIVRQGDSRVTGLQQLLENGLAIFHAVSSTHWPGAAGVKISHVHLFNGQWRGQKTLDYDQVECISSFLRAEQGESKEPFTLAANDGLCFTGHYLMGQGFVLSDAEAKELIAKNNRNEEVIFDYIRGDDVNNCPHLLTGQKVINFDLRDLEECRRRFPECLAHVERLVKPERSLVKSKADRENWWQYARARPKLNEATAKLQQVLVQPFVAKYVILCFVPARAVFAHPLVVIPDPRFDRFAVLQSTLHLVWVWEYCSTNLDLLRYTASDVLETFPFPTKLTLQVLHGLGQQYISHRDSIRLGRFQSVNEIYNRFHLPGEKSADIVRLRALHREMDQGVAVAYGWTDLDLGHDFHETKQGARYTISESARRTVLDRLLQLNHQRYEEEVKAGLHDKKAKSKSTGGKRGRKAKNEASDPVPTLFK